MIIDRVDAMIKRYSIFGRIGSIDQKIIFFVDGTSYHGGMCDRFNGAIDGYAYSIIKHIGFGIRYTFPFNLTDFLVPNEYNWVIKDKDISNNIFRVKLIKMVGCQNIEKLKRIQTNKQIHLYANRNYLEQINKEYGTSFSYGYLFHQLFSPTPELEERIQFYKTQIKGEYISVAFRFQNLLGDFSEYQYPALPENRKIELINKCKNSLIKLSKEQEKFNRKILVTADSCTFLQEIANLNDIYAVQGKAVHLDTKGQRNATHETYLKSFIDLYLLAGGAKVYSIASKEMYKSGFPLTASYIGNIPFERINI